MLGILKTLQGFFDNLNLPEGIKLVTDLVWDLRWFITIGLVGLGIYNMIMTMLPYLMWSFILKGIFGSLFNIFRLFA
jgi:hypothetical protein